MLNRAALRLLVSRLDEPACGPKLKVFAEDVQVARCLATASPPVIPYDTRDELGRERFLPFTPQNHLTYRVPKNPDWYAKYSIGLKEGYDCCSTRAVSFHYVKPDLMPRMSALLYDCRLEAS